MHAITELKNYKAATFNVQTVALNFELYEHEVLVSNHMHLQRAHKGALCLYGDELELISINLNGEMLAPSAYTIVDNNLIINTTADELHLVIVTRLNPQNNAKLSGLYRSGELFCTQCEAEGFRRISFFLDRPDVLAIYSTRICADKARYPILLSNGNLVDCGESPDGRHWVSWHDPFKKPSYLFALVAGRLECVCDSFITCSGRKVSLKIYVEAGDEDKCAHAMASLKKAMRWDEEQYGREYDLDIFMIVAVRDFNMGAMENKGLNIFNSKYILARPDTASDQDYADIEGVIAHEYFHNWTGNRVTCRDWFQLSLKEGLTVFRDQEFSRDMNSRELLRILDVKLLRNAQFPEDAGSMAHPVQPSSYQEINNFYTATIYNKGAELIRMQETLLGKGRFRRGMDLYFQRHDGCAVTIEDFVRAMEDANDFDLTQFRRWYIQAGTPRVEVLSSYANGCLSLKLSQSCPPTEECADKLDFHIPLRIALFTQDGESIKLESNIIELCAKSQVFYFKGLKAQPIVSLLRDFSAPIILNYALSQAELLALLRYEDNGFAKWEAAQRLALNCIINYYNSPCDFWQLPLELSNAYKTVLQDERIDQAMRAQILTIPSFEDVALELRDIKVDLLEQARAAFQRHVALALYDVACSYYRDLWAIEDHAMNGSAYARRALRNICLRMMMLADEAATLLICQTQFAAAQTMTDQITSLALLNNCSTSSVRLQAFDDFYSQWAQNELVLDKWFALQASCEHKNSLDGIKALLLHPAFNLKNPNKVRALIGAFTQNNPRNFHALDGSAYEFLTDILIKLDRLNPQIAARLASPFTRGSRFNHINRSLIKQQLERLAALELSKDLSEIVSKSLITI